MNPMVLNDGTVIPTVGFGVFQIPNDGSTYRAVRPAHIDTAAAYFNEGEVGQAVRESGIPREEIFVTSKLWLQDHGYGAAQAGIQASLDKLGLGYIDLYLVHQPYSDVPGAWKAMEEAKKQGKKPLLTTFSVYNLARNNNFDSCKAERELGYHTRSYRETMHDEIAWLKSTGKIRG